MAPTEGSGPHGPRVGKCAGRPAPSPRGVDPSVARKDFCTMELPACTPSGNQSRLLFPRRCRRPEILGRAVAAGEGTAIRIFRGRGYRPHGTEGGRGTDHLIAIRKKPAVPDGRAWESLDGPGCRCAVEWLGRMAAVERGTTGRGGEKRQRTTPDGSMRAFGAPGRTGALGGGRGGSPFGRLFISCLIRDYLRPYPAAGVRMPCTEPTTRRRARLHALSTSFVAVKW